MKIARGLLQASLVLAVPAFSQTSKVPLDQYRNRILARELDAQVAGRLIRYRACLREVERHGPNSPVFARVRKIERRYRDSTDPAQMDFIKSLALLEVDRVLVAAEALPGKCAEELRKGRAALDRQERKKFTAAYVAAQLVQIPGRPYRVSAASRLLFELDPSCATRVSESWLGGVDGNPCFAGAGIILSRNFAGYGPEFDASLENYSRRMEQLKAAVLDSGVGQQLQLSRVMGLSAPESVGLIAMATSSSTSSNGYVSAYGLLLIRSTWMSGGDPLLAYTRYMKLKNLADTFAFVLKRVAGKALGFTLAGVDVTAWNRHNWMSAALTLHYYDRGLGALARRVPVLLGTVYEAKDAVSHLREGQSLRDAWRGLQTDRQRYLDGARLARQLQVD